MKAENDGPILNALPESSCSALLGACVGMTIGALIGNVLVALMDTSSRGWVGCVFVQIATTWTIYWAARRKKAPNNR